MYNDFLFIKQQFAIWTFHFWSLNYVYSAYWTRSTTGCPEVLLSDYGTSTRLWLHLCNEGRAVLHQLNYIYVMRACLCWLIKCRCLRTFGFSPTPAYPCYKSGPFCKHYSGFRELSWGINMLVTKISLKYWSLTHLRRGERDSVS